MSLHTVTLSVDFHDCDSARDAARWLLDMVREGGWQDLTFKVHGPGGQVEPVDWSEDDYVRETGVPYSEPA